MASVSSAARRQAGPLVVEQEALDVRRQVGVGLVAVAAGDAHQLEAAALGLVAGGQLVAPPLDVGDRALEQLGQQLGRHRIVGDQHDRLDRPQVVAVVGGQSNVVELVHRQPS